MAAGTIKGITIEIEGKTSGLVKSLGNVNKSLSETQKSLKTVNDALKLDPKNVDTLKTKQQLLNQAINETEEKLKLEKQAAADAAEALEKGTITKNQYDTLQAEVAKTSGELQKLKGEAQNTNKQLKELGSGTKLDSFKAALKGAQDKLAEFGKKVTAVGKELSTKVTLPIVALGTASVKTAADFDASMSKVAAVSGATGDDLEALRSKAREMGESTKFSASEAAEAMNYMAMAGWKTEDMLNGISGIMNLAAASGEELGTTSDIVTDALTAFGMTAADAGRFADVLAAASSNANTNVSMMGESFKYVAPVAGAMGYSIEDVSIALGLMANSGIKASQAGTSLRTILTNMAKPTDTMEAAMERLGVTLDDGNGNMKTLRELMIELRDGFGGLKIPADQLQKSIASLDKQLEDGTITEEEYDKQMEELTISAYGAEGAIKAEAAASLAGARGMSALLAIVNSSDEDFDKLTQAIDGSNGAAENMANIMEDNLEGRITKVKSKLQEAAITIGEKLIPIIEKLVEWISGVIDWFNGLDSTTQTIILTIAGLVAAIGPVLILIGKLSTGVSAIIGLIGSVSGAIAGAGGLGSVLTTLCTGPFAAVIASIGAIIAITQNWEEISEVLEFAWEKVCDALAEVFNTLKNIWSDVVDSVEQGIESIFGHIEGGYAALNKGAQAGYEFIGQSESEIQAQIARNRANLEAKNAAKNSSANSNAAIYSSRELSRRQSKTISTSGMPSNINVNIGSAKVDTVVAKAGQSNASRTGGH